jgi:hypothetical protein
MVAITVGDFTSGRALSLLPLRAFAVPLMLGALCGCVRRFVECNDTDTCRAQIAERDRQFAQRVAEEPAAVRLDVEPVSSLALADRSRQLVYAVDPGLVALELKTGAERWRVPGVTGGALWRVGRFLVVSPERAPRAPALTFVDPQAPTKPMTCALALAAPEIADTVALHPFDRGGQPYVFWSSKYLRKNNLTSVRTEGCAWCWEAHPCTTFG